MYVKNIALKLAVPPPPVVGGGGGGDGGGVSSSHRIPILSQ